MFSGVLPPNKAFFRSLFSPLNGSWLERGFSPGSLSASFLSLALENE
jgi:hypothetical protein